MERREDSGRRDLVPFSLPPNEIAQFWDSQLINLGGAPSIGGTGDFGILLNSRRVRNVPDELAGTSVEASSHKTPATFPTGQLNRWCVCFEHIVGWPTTVRSTYHGAFPPLPRNCSWPSAMTAGNLVFGSRGGRTDTSAACVIRPTEPAGDSRTASFRYAYISFLTCWVRRR